MKPDLDFSLLILALIFMFATLVSENESARRIFIKISAFFTVAALAAMLHSHLF